MIGALFIPDNLVLLMQLMLLFLLLFMVLLLMIMLWMTSSAEWFANHGESLKGGSGQAPPTAHLVDICQSFLSQETRIYKCAQCDLLMYTYVERSDIQRRIDGREGQTANSKCQQMIAVATDGQLDRLLFRLFRKQKSIVCWLLKLLSLNMNV